MEGRKEHLPIYETIWRFFISLKLTLFLLISITGLSVIGTFLLQDKSIEELLQVYPAWLVSLFSSLGFFQMYRSTIFLLLVLLLSLNITACSINRFPSSWKRALGGKKINFQPFGVYFVHSSVLIIFGGALYGQVFGFNGMVSLEEGKSSSLCYVSVGLGNYLPVKLPVEVKLNDFKLELFESGRPKDYKSSLEIFKNNEQVATKTIEVNDPLEYEGLNFYQASYQEIQPDVSVTLIFKKRENKETILEATVKEGESVSFAEHKGRFVIDAFELDKMGTGPALTLTRITPEGKRNEFVIFQKFPMFDEKNRDDDIIVEMKDYSYKRRFVSGIEVAHDPGAPMVFAGTIIMMIGLFISLYRKGSAT